MVLPAEQECHLTTDQAINDYHLDQTPGYEIKANGTQSCDQLLALDLSKCQQAQLILDEFVTNVEEIDEGNSVGGCYREKQSEYRFQHNQSSYKWYFNSAGTTIQSDAKSEPVCAGKATRGSCLRTWS